MVEVRSQASKGLEKDKLLRKAACDYCQVKNSSEFLADSIIVRFSCVADPRVKTIMSNNKARQQAHRNKKKALQTEINRLSGADPNSNFGHTLRDRSIADLEESLRQLQVAHSQNSTQIEGNGDANNQGMELDDDGAASQRAAMSPSAGSEFGIWTSFQHDLDFMLQHESTGEVAYDPDELQGWGYEDHDDPYYP
ncbi:hypothetical protein I350_03896 [Cryptococcus amylolentus CBS 6273]|uniref:Uncharacterized protein n=1 Tax=Cryptococcus amylolentus CBS 6273 TaxID=1296118 RepID=A0A1E3K0I8_9TREE|nr:hypothetical protein I350_03896 [Cryptococcus amylolentus CBS 6273]